MGIFFAVIILVLGHIIYAGNPIIKDIGMSDPHVRVFNDTVYLYAGHDDDPNDPLWVMKEWRIFRSTDLVDLFWLGRQLWNFFILTDDPLWININN
jgi:arabinoxylan arabinofuranohydrolase